MRGGRVYFSCAVDEDEDDDGDGGARRNCFVCKRQEKGIAGQRWEQVDGRQRSKEEQES